jgi:hypothetical protein
MAPQRDLLMIGPGTVLDGGKSATYLGGPLHLNAGIALGGRDDTPKEGNWAYIWLIQHRWAPTRVSLVLSSSPVEPVLVSKCFKGISRWWLVGVFPIGAQGTVEGRVFRFRRPCPVPISDGPVQLPTPGVSTRELVEVMVVDRSGHGVSVFDGDLVEVPDPPVAPVHTPSNGIGGGPPVVSRGAVVAVEGRVYVVQDLAGSGRAEAQLFLCGVHL